MEKTVLRLVDGSYAVCEVDRVSISAVESWRYSEIHRVWVRTLAVLTYRGASLAEAEAFARGAGLL